MIRFEKEPPTRGTRLTWRLTVAAVALSFGLMACGKNSSAKFRQYYVHGEQLYEKHCSNCHQADGSGLRRVYPPLNTSDYMKNNFHDVVCLIRYGKRGELIVNGQQFNQAMYGISNLTDIEVAEITTYIYNTWTHDRGLIDVKEATAILATCKDPDQK
jgi:mono/diheme cytochrome c family protein